MIGITGMCISMHLIGQCSAVPDHVAAKIESGSTFLLFNPVFLSPPVLCQLSGLIKLNEELCFFIQG